MSQYSSKLRDPRWQKKRLEVMESAGFKCARCGEEGEELNVHHVVYQKGLDPWEYDTVDLACLCKSCHEATHSAIKDLSRLASSIADPPFYGLMKIIAMAKENPWVIHSLGCLCSNFTAEQLDQLGAMSDAAVSKGIEIQKSRTPCK